MIEFEFLKVSTMRGNGDVINDCYRIVPGEELEMTDLTLEDLTLLYVHLGRFIERESLHREIIAGKEKGAGR